MTVATVSAFAAQLVSHVKRRDATFMVGAGLSMLSPSGLPSGPELKRLVMAGISADRALSSYWVRARSLHRFQQIVPEIVFQRVYECLDEKFDRVFATLKIAVPNPAHDVVAALSATLRQPILTTNFDLLLETARPPAVDVLHLHGGLDDPSQMVYRINRVALGLPRDLTRRLALSVRGRTLCVLGYSGLDKDVIDAINAAAPRRVLWLARSRTDVAVKSAEKLKCRRVVIGVGDLRQLVRQIRRRAHIGHSDSWPVQSHGRASRLRAFLNWKATLSRDERYAALSAVLFEIAEYRAAAEVALSGATLRHHKRVSRAWFHRQAANALKVHGDFAKALNVALRATRQQRVSPYERAAAWSMVGLVHLEKDEFDARRAVTAFRRAMRWLNKARVVRLPAHRREQIQLLRGRLYNNLGLALTYRGRPTAALRAYNQSLTAKGLIGDVIGIAHTTSNVSVLFYRQRRHRAARRWRVRAMAMLVRYDLHFEKAYLLRQTGALACQQGRRKTGLTLLRQALQVYRSLSSARFGAKLTRRIIRQYEAAG